MRSCDRSSAAEFASKRHTCESVIVQHPAGKSRHDRRLAGLWTRNELKIRRPKTPESFVAKNESGSPLPLSIYLRFARNHCGLMRANGFLNPRERFGMFFRHVEFFRRVLSQIVHQRRIMRFGRIITVTGLCDEMRFVI